MGGSPASFSDIGKRAKDVLTKDYSFDHMLTLSISRLTRMGLTAIGLRKGKIFFNNLYKRGNTIIDVKVDTDSNISTKVTVNDVLPSTKAAISFKLSHRKSGKDKLDMPYLHDDYAIYDSISLNLTPILELSAATESKELTLGGEVGFDVASGSFTKFKGRDWVEQNRTLSRFFS
ncbi:hypothetical protein K2173_016044 [Erythroxylum novogranatense]|uniref:Uncharacterized protein n=1 Tax=Erythroxylum novogranatense TaxID=1862640 RepID=A0AAV8SFN5_9ROSI|nr:hypothetical protein K2173_016044 [Erythroxylum novogranatense]